MDITRVHLEEDTANNKHADNYSLIDFNRAGVPLMELVTEPHTFESIEETAKVATNFAKELQLILWYLGVSEANLEKGEMRVEPNISISKDPKILATKVEVKNLNSFRSVERAIKYELERMMELYEEGREAGMKPNKKHFLREKRRVVQTIDISLIQTSQR
jgi:aspartyl-tRNA(Asn)/glutamyl-tRNA(Gln) amidotransferase subunit B